MSLFDKTALGEKFANLKKLQNNVLDIWFDAMDNEIKEFVLDLIRFNQLSNGINSKGDIIGKYSAMTEQISGGRKQEGDPYTLFDTGAFYESLFIEVDLDDMIIDGNGFKSGLRRIKGRDITVSINLFEEFGDEIIGLTEDSMQQFIDKLKIKMIEKCREYITRA